MKLPSIYLVLSFIVNKAAGLEAQLLEEPLVLAGLVALLEFDAGLETMGLPLNGVLQVLGRNFLELNVDTVSGGHQMVVVQQLKEQETLAKDRKLDFLTVPSRKA